MIFPVAVESILVTLFVGYFLLPILVTELQYCVCRSLALRKSQKESERVRKSQKESERMSGDGIAKVWRVNTADFAFNQEFVLVRTCAFRLRGPRALMLR